MVLINKMILQIKAEFKQEHLLIIVDLVILTL